jgi:uncharacterized protein
MYIMTTRYADWGGFLPVDESGFIVNICHAGLITDPWDAVLDRLMMLCKTNLGDLLHSMYVRGSVASGTAIPGLSDIDTLAVVNTDNASVDLTWRDDYVKSAQSEFPFVTKIELDIYSVERMMHAPAMAPVRFAISTQSVCVYGNSLLPHLPRYRPGAETIFHIPRLACRLEEVRQALQVSVQADRKKEVCRWIMKSLIRSAFELTVIEERRYSRELSLCCKVFAWHYPSMAASARRALEYALNPSSDERVIIDVSQSFGMWIIEEAQKKMT